jgi:cation:H+ antiporter
MTLLWVQFVFCSALILVAGARLMAYGDAIAHRTGLGGTWIGMTLLATVTSLPELVSGATAVTGAGAPDIAVGDVLGSCVFNLALLALVDIAHPARSAFDVASRGHAVAAGFSIVTLTLIGAWLSAQRLPAGSAPPGWTLALLLVCLYLAAMRIIYRRERSAAAAVLPDRRLPSLRAAVAGYVLAGIVVVAAAIWLPYLAVRVAVAMGWSQGFVGTFLVAISTSLPELAVTLAAIRSGAIDLAVGNLLGSNLFNMVVLALDIGLMLPDNLLARVSAVHLTSVLTASLMTVAVMLALATPPRRRLLDAVSRTSVALLLLFLFNAWLHVRQAP